MNRMMISRRYAEGLGALIETPALEEAHQSLQALANAFTSDPLLHGVLTNPVLPLNKRQVVLDEVIDRLQTPTLVARLVRQLLGRGRIALLSNVAAAFAATVDARLNRTVAVVETAEPLDDVQRQRVGDGLARYSGKTLQIEFRLNPAILGGVKARIGGMLIDSTVRTHIDRLTQALLSEGELKE